MAARFYSFQAIAPRKKILVSSLELNYQRSHNKERTKCQPPSSTGYTIPFFVIFQNEAYLSFN